jgi:hypothetical protein
MSLARALFEYVVYHRYNQKGICGTPLADFGKFKSVKFSDPLIFSSNVGIKLPYRLVWL